MKLCSFPYEKYRVSDNEWHEYIPSTWDETRVKNIFKLITDIAPNDNDFELLSLYASIGVKPRKDMEQRGNKSVTTDGYWIVKKGDIVVNKLLAWMGAIGLSEYDGVTSPAYDILRKSNRETDARFYTYLFRTEKAKSIFKKHSRGIMDVRLRLYFDKFGAITVPFPPVTEQKTIARYLDTKTAQCDRKIDLLTQKATLYGKLKQSLINETVTGGLDKSVPMKDSKIDAINKIPEHWEVNRVKDVGVNGLINGLFKKKDDFGFGVKLINVSDLYQANNTISCNQLDRVNATKDEINRYIVASGDIFFVRSSLKLEGIGVSALLEEAQEKTVFECHIIRFRPNSKFVSPKFMKYTLNSNNMKWKFIIVSKTVTMTTISQEKISSIELPVPPLSEQKAIADYLDTKTAQIDQIIQSINTQIEKLKELRKTLINDVVTGKIKV